MSQSLTDPPTLPTALSPSDQLATALRQLSSKALNQSKWAQARLYQAADELQDSGRRDRFSAQQKTQHGRAQKGSKTAAGCLIEALTVVCNVSDFSTYVLESARHYPNSSDHDPNTHTRYVGALLAERALTRMKKDGVRSFRGWLTAAKILRSHFPDLAEHLDAAERGAIYDIDIPSMEDEVKMDRCQNAIQEE